MWQWGPTWEDETEGGWFEKELLSFTEGHGNADGAHHHHAQTQKGQDGRCNIQICEGERKKLKEETEWRFSSFTRQEVYRKDGKNILETGQVVESDMFNSTGLRVDNTWVLKCENTTLVWIEPLPKLALLKKKPLFWHWITEQVQPKKQISISAGASFVFFDNPSHRYYYFIN